MHFNHYGGPGAQLAAMLVNLTSAKSSGAAEVNAALAECGVRVGKFGEPGAP